MPDILGVFLLVSVFVYALFWLVTKLTCSKLSDFDRLLTSIKSFAEYGVNERLTPGSFKKYAHGDAIYVMVLDKKLYRHRFTYEGEWQCTVELEYTSEADARDVAGMLTDPLDGPPR